MGSKSAWKVVKLDASKKSYKDITPCKGTAGLSTKEYGVHVGQNHAIPTRGMSKNGGENQLKGIPGTLYLFPEKERS